MALDHSQLGPPSNGFRWKFVEPPDHPEVLEMLRAILLPALIPVGYKDEYAEDFLELFRQMLNSGTNLSYVAVDEASGEIAAARMVERRQKTDPVVDYPPNFKHQKSIDMFRLFGVLLKETDIYGKYGVDKFADMFGLCTKTKFRQRGLANEAYRRGLNMLQRKGFEIVKVDFISPFSRAAGIKNGFIQGSRRYFHDCKDQDGNVLNPEANPEHYINTGVFDLRKRTIQEAAFN